MHNTDPLSAPTNVRLGHINNKTHTSFSWATMSPPCSSVQYNIYTTNCGRCPSSTDLASVVCESVDLSVPTSLQGHNICSIAIQTRCGNVIGNISNIFQQAMKGRVL